MGPIEDGRRDRRVDPPSHRAAIVAGWVLFSVFVFCGLLAALMSLGDPAGGLSDGEFQRFAVMKQWSAPGLLLLAVLSLLWSAMWMVHDGRYRFNAPPGWPAPPAGWRPPRGWVPPASFPDAPAGWRLWTRC